MHTYPCVLNYTLHLRSYCYAEHILNCILINLTDVQNSVEMLWFNFYNSCVINDCYLFDQIQLNLLDWKNCKVDVFDNLRLLRLSHLHLSCALLSFFLLLFQSSYFILYKIRREMKYERDADSIVVNRHSSLFPSSNDVTSNTWSSCVSHAFFFSNEFSFRLGSDLRDPWCGFRLVHR